MARDLWAIGEDLVKNKSWGKKFRHSKFFDPFRRTSVSRIGKMGIATGIAFIPIPVVKSLVDNAVKRGLAAVRQAQKKHKFTKHRFDIEHKVKWGWKDLDVQDLDRYRWKVKHGVETLNKAVAEAQGNASTTATYCNDWSRAISKYIYLDSRLKKLEEQVAVLKQLCIDTERWTSDVRNSLVTADVETKLRKRAQSVPGPGGEHAECDKTLCVHANDKRFWSERHKLVQGVTTIASFAVDSLDPKAMDTYSADTYEKS